ncbi:MAG: competence/damage-inducible protein A, partial [Clostridia bacterium]|nr:competence/damage-inducible protein A [Clostridia bacterium]
MQKSLSCEILAVGTELLLGQIANTDAQMLSQGLSELGISVFHHTVVGDNPQRLREAVELAKSRADIIITTGGLGPTADDLTKETIASAFGKKLELHGPSLKRLYDRWTFGKMTKNNERQAWLPEGCEVLVNDWGTAPGCAFEAEGVHVVMLPGPPRECTAMWKHRARPYLEKLTGGAIVSHYIRLYGIGESAMEDKIAYIMDNAINPSAAPYAKEGECLVRVTAKGENHDVAEEMTKPLMEQICSELKDFVYGIDVESLEEVLVALLKEKNLTISTAESCTGGYISKRLTDIPGCSDVFMGGMVTYSNESKMKLLGVKEETLRAHGAVSEETAYEMAKNVAEIMGTDIGVGITGIAGPGG